MRGNKIYGCVVHGWEKLLPEKTFFLGKDISPFGADIELFNCKTQLGVAECL